MEIDLRNNSTIRNIFAEIITILCQSNKKPSFETIKINRVEEFDMTIIKDRFLNIQSRPPCVSSTRDFPYQEVAQLIMVIHMCTVSHALAVKSNLGKILRKYRFSDF